jgi:hypothetical protein
MPYALCFPKSAIIGSPFRLPRSNLLLIRLCGQNRGILENKTKIGG